MKAAFYVGPNQMEIHDYQTPSPEPDEVLVRIKSTGICGSDLNMNLAKTGPDIAFPVPIPSTATFLPIFSGLTR